VTTTKKCPKPKDPQTRVLLNIYPSALDTKIRLVYDIHSAPHTAGCVSPWWALPRARPFFMFSPCGRPATANAGHANERGFNAEYNVGTPQNTGSLQFVISNFCSCNQTAFRSRIESRLPVLANFLSKRSCAPLLAANSV
jgi:hypothetical protein